MTKTKKTRPDKKSDTKSTLPVEPWISMRNGIIIIIFASIGIAVLTAIQVAPVRGWLEAAFWGLLFGGLIWVIFFGMIFINRFLKR